MSKSQALRSEDHRAAHELSHQCRDLGDSFRHWQLHFFATASRHVGADAVAGGEVGGFAAGQPFEISVPVDWGFGAQFDVAGWQQARELLRTDPGFSPLLTRYICQCGQVRGVALRRSDAVSPVEWDAAPVREAQRIMGVGYSLCCFRPVPGSADEVFGGVFYRGEEGRDFTNHDVKVIEEDFAAIAPLLGGSLARSAEPSPGGLSPRLRQVLRCVLDGDCGKQIAARLGIRLDTVNEYLQAIFQHFHVGGRPELMARWIRRGWGARCEWADQTPS